MKRVGRPTALRVAAPRGEGTGSLRAILAAVASVPVLAGVYLLCLRTHPRAIRFGLLALAVAAAGSFAVLRLVPPAEGHRPPPVDTRAIARLATPVVGNVGGDQQVGLAFSEPMDHDSVQAALTVVPMAALELSWSAGDTALAITPLHGWAPGTVYTIAVGTGARSAAGNQLAEPVRAVFLTRDAPTATIVATAMSGRLASPASSFRIDFSRPVDLASLRAGFRITPAVAGDFETDLRRGDPTSVTFVPSAPLAAFTTYVATFAAPVLSTDGMAVASVPRLVVRTLDQPAVVRTRPADHAQGVPADASVSVRFTRPMDTARTQAAFRLMASPEGTKVAGSMSWAENDTVLVFRPSHALVAGHVYALSLAGSAAAKDGLGIALPDGASALRAAFRVAAPPAPALKKAATPAGPSPASTPSPPASRGTSTAPWLSVEQYALQLLNCTRTGGWVSSDGSCDGYGSGKYSAYVEPLTLSAGISNAVTRPYAKLLADNGVCSHFYDGNPGDRLARAGYTSWRWAENIGCQDGAPRQVAINSLTFFQSEKSYAGGHWVNLRNAAYTTVGIGVWVHNGYVLVVYDFYAP